MSYLTEYFYIFLVSSVASVLTSFVYIIFSKSHLKEVNFCGLKLISFIEKEIEKDLNLIPDNVKQEFINSIELSIKDAITKHFPSVEKEKTTTSTDQEQKNNAVSSDNFSFDNIYSKA